MVVRLSHVLHVVHDVTAQTLVRLISAVSKLIKHHIEEQEGIDENIAQVARMHRRVHPVLQARNAQTAPAAQGDVLKACGRCDVFLTCLCLSRTETSRLMILPSQEERPSLPDPVVLCVCDPLVSYDLA